MTLLLMLFFEVMDKEPAITELWAIFGVVSLGGFILAYWKWPFVILSALVDTVLTWAYLAEFHDPDINPAIWKEDPAYLPQFYLMVGAALILPVVGALLRLRKSDRPN